MNAVRYFTAGALCLAVVTVGAGLTSCRKKTLSVEEAKVSIEEIASFMRTIEGDGTASETLALTEQLNATAPLSKLLKDNLVATLRVEVEIENRVLQIVGPFEDDKWYLDDRAMKAAVAAIDGWEQFAREKVREERRIYRDYIDDVCEILPPEGMRRARDSMHRVMPYYDQYETLPAEVADATFRATGTLFAFLLSNKAGMKDSGLGPEWDSESLNDEFNRIIADVQREGETFDERLAALLSKRADMIRETQEAMQTALSELTM